MPESKPQWYFDLKRGPFVSVPKPTQDMINAIERRVKKANSQKFMPVLISIPFAFFLAFVLIQGFWTTDKGENSTLQADDGRVYSDEGELITMDKKWLLPRYTFEAYLAFSKNKTDDVLMGLEPLDILRIYAYASEKGDYEALYALFIQGTHYGTPSRDEYLSDAITGSGLQEQAKGQWEAWKKGYRLQEEVKGNHAVIQMISSDSSKMSDKLFRLIKNEKGVWKVRWPAIQG